MNGTAGLAKVRAWVSRAVVRACAGVAVMGVGVGVGVGWGCGERGYSQETPEEVVRSAVLMIERGEAKRLGELMYGADVYERAFFRRVGSLLGSMQGLAEALARAFPREVEAAKEQAVARAARGARSGSAVSMLMSRTASGEQREAAMQTLMREVFADPFGWANEASSRVTFAPINEDLVAVMWDGKPVPPFGLTMRRSEGKWFVVAPTNIPFLVRYLPQTKEDWSLWASLVRLIDNAVVDLTGDVREGRVASFSDTGRKVGEKLFMPGALALVAVEKHYRLKFQRQREARSGASSPG